MLQNRKSSFSYNVFVILKAIVKLYLKDCRLDSKKPEQHNRKASVLVANVLSTMS